MKQRLPELPVPKDRVGLGCGWTWFILGIENPTGSGLRQLAQHFWPKAADCLGKPSEIALELPDDDAWWHLRRAPGRGISPKFSMLGTHTFQMLTLRDDRLTSSVKDDLLSAAATQSSVKSFGWWPTDWRTPQDRLFLSFLQRISLLRLESGGPLIHEWLGGSTASEATKAFGVMTRSAEVWSEPIRPWLDRLSSEGADINVMCDYAHWFGHVLSRGPG